MHCCACVLFYVLSPFHFRMSPALKVIYTRPQHSPCVFLFVCLLTIFCVCVCVCDMLAQKVSFLILQGSVSNHSHLYFLFFSIYQLFTELKTLSSRYGWNLLLVSSYTSRVTSASIYPIPSTVAFFFASVHIAVECAYMKPGLQPPSWTCVDTSHDPDTGLE